MVRSSSCLVGAATMDAAAVADTNNPVFFHDGSFGRGGGWRLGKRAGKRTRRNKLPLSSTTTRHPLFPRRRSPPEKPDRPLGFRTDAVDHNQTNNRKGKKTGLSTSRRIGQGLFCPVVVTALIQVHINSFIHLIGRECFGTAAS
jgi:hypothetical protein